MKDLLYICLILPFLFGCSPDIQEIKHLENTGSEKDNEKTEVDSLFLIQQKATSILTEIYQSVEVEIEETDYNWLEISYKTDSAHVGIETQRLLAFILADELFDYISSYDRAYIGTVIDTMIISHRLNKEDIEMNHEMFIENKTFKEIFYSVIPDLNDNQILFSNMLIKDLGLVDSNYNYKGTFWDLLITYSQGIDENNDLKKQSFEDFASFLFLQEEIDGKYIGPPHFTIDKLLSFSSLTKSDVALLSASRMENQSNFKIPNNRKRNRKFYQLEEDFLDQNGVQMKTIIAIHYKTSIDDENSSQAKTEIEYIDEYSKNLIKEIFKKRIYEEVYSTKRGELELEIAEQLSKDFQKNNLELLYLELRDVTLPKYAVEELLKKQANK